MSSGTTPPPRPLPTLCSPECEREYVHGCMAYSVTRGCHRECWAAVRANTLHGVRCSSGCHPTYLMMTARCGADADAMPPAEMISSFDAQRSTAMSALASQYHVHVGPHGSLDLRLHGRHCVTLLLACRNLMVYRHLTWRDTESMVKHLPLVQQYAAIL